MGRKRWDSNPRAREDYLISSFMKCVTKTGQLVSASGSFVPAAKPHKHWDFHTESLKKPDISGEFEYDRKTAQIRIFGKNGKNKNQKATQLIEQCDNYQQSSNPTKS